MIVKVALPLILAFIMFSLGLGLRKQDFTRVFKQPKAFGAGVFNQLILLPVLAFGLVKAFDFSPELAIGVMILSFCPGGVTSNVLTKMGNGNTPLSISLTAITSLVSIVTVPILVALSVRHFWGVKGPEVDVASLGIKMFFITALPVLLGIVLTSQAPDFAEKISKNVSRTALVLFVLVIIAALAKNWVVFSSNLPTLGPALILLNVAMLALGVIVSRILNLSPHDATAISVESGVQNGTLGIAVGSLIVLNAVEALPPTTVPSAVYSITMYFISIPFVLWRRRATQAMR